MSHGISLPMGANQQYRLLQRRFRMQVLEYACPVWHSGLTAGQSDTLKSLQKGALKIIFCDIDYHMSLILAGLDTLQS